MSQPSLAHAQTEDPIDTVLARLSNVKPTGENKWRACCPGHDDEHPSLDVTRGDDGRVLLFCRSRRCTCRAICSAIGLTEADLFDRRGMGNRSTSMKSKSKVYSTVEAYTRTLGALCGGSWVYADASGRPVMATVRINPAKTGEKKKFVILRPCAGNWGFGAPAGKRPLYRLDEIESARKKGARRIFVVEGEKCADQLRKLGVPATTWSGGACAVHKTDFSPLAHFEEVVFLPDNDPPGRKAAQLVACITVNLNAAAQLKILELPGLPEDGGDIVDYVAARPGQSIDEIKRGIDELIADAPLFTSSENRESTELVASSSGTSTEESRYRPVMTRFDAIVERPIEWEWEKRIARKKLTTIQGDPGLGKSFVTIDIVSRLSTGCGWPDRPGEAIPPASSIIMSAEDDPEDTIKPRLRYAGADLKRIHFLSGVMRFNAETLSSEERLIAFDTDMHAVEEAIADVVDCAIVVVDPISAYMGETKTHENAAVRGVLAKLSALAKRRNVAVLAVMHLNKSGGSNAVYRGQGSIAFNAAARTVWHIAPDPENNKRRFMVPVKNNIADDCGGLAFSVGRLPFAEGPTVQWEAAPVDMNANEVLLATERLESRKTQGVVEATTDWLTEQLI